MKKYIILLIICTLNSCVDKQKAIKLEKIKLDFNLEKVVVINLNEVCVTYFKMKITNSSNQEIILQDNSLKDILYQNLRIKKEGFYLNNNDNIIPLAIDKYYFYEVGPKISGYCFIGTTNIKDSYYVKDSLKLRKIITNSLLEYNGKNFDLNKIKKNNYISDIRFEKFIKNKHNYIAYKDSLSIKIPEKIEIKYIREMPFESEVWDKL
jgi:hypothetical protein